MSTTTTGGPDVLPLSERRRQASRELMRTEILAAAQLIIRTRGLDSLSLRALAKEVGVTAPALYEYFDSKDAILKALFVQGSEVMLGLMDELIASTQPGLRRVEAILGGYRSFARNEPDYFRLLFGTVDPNLDLVEEEYAGMETIFHRFVGAIVDGIAVGELKPLPPMTLSCSLWALVHGAALLETESFMAKKDMDGDGKVPEFDGAIKLALLGFATEAGAELIGAVEDPC